MSHVRRVSVLCPAPSAPAARYHWKRCTYTISGPLATANGLILGMEPQPYLVAQRYTSA